MNGYPVDPVITQSKKIIGKTIALRNVNPDDAEFIIALRINEKKGRFISKTAANVDSQRSWIQSYLNGSGQAYFIIENLSGERLGTIRLYDQKGDSFCWGSWLIIENAPKTTAIESALMLYDYALKLGFNKSHFDVRKGNISVRRFHEKFGAVKIREDDIDVYYEISKESIINSSLKYNKYLPSGIKIL